MQGSKYNAYIYGYKYTNACVSQVNTNQSNSVSAINLKSEMGSVYLHYSMHWITSVHHYLQEKSISIVCSFMQPQLNKPTATKF